MYVCMYVCMYGSSDPVAVAQYGLLDAKKEAY
jgi:hypothetical protein